jgi:hypothetical protein
MLPAGRYRGLLFTQILKYLTQRRSHFPRQRPADREVMLGRPLSCVILSRGTHYRFACALPVGLRTPTETGRRKANISRLNERRVQELFPNGPERLL